jgi:DNA polymerase-3 subunit epsilon
VVDVDLADPTPGRPAAGPRCRDDAAPAAVPLGLPRFAVVDIETSGLSTRRHRILQIGLAVVDGGAVVDRWETLVRLRWPLQRVGPRKVHGIGRAQLRGAPRLHEVLVELARRLDGAVFTAHNVAFDATFLERAARREGVALELGPQLCTLRLSRRLDPERSRSHRLSDLCERYGIAPGRAHHALDDALATAAVLPHLLDEHGILSGADLTELYERR